MVSLPAAAQSAPTAGATSPEAGESESSAWSLYARAFEAHLAGRDDEARALLERVQRDYPTHPAAARARDAERLIAGVPPAVGPAPGDLGALLRAEKPTAIARAELAILQTFGGIAAGFEFCGALECDDSRALIGSAILGGGAGLGLSLGLTRGGITPGHALAINSGTGWGFWNGLSVALILEREGRSTFGWMLGGQLLGTGAGHLAYRLFAPSAGDVSFANSAGIWSGVFASLLIAADQDYGPTSETLLVVSDLGLVAGGLLASRVPMSRGRALLLDAGGLLGLLLGFGVDVLVEGGEADDTAFFLSGAAGTVLGLGTAFWFSRGWDLPDAPPVALMLQPRRGGASVVLGATF